MSCTVDKCISIRYSMMYKRWFISDECTCSSLYHPRQLCIMLFGERFCWIVNLNVELVYPSIYVFLLSKIVALLHTFCKFIPFIRQYFVVVDNLREMKKKIGSTEDEMFTMRNNSRRYPGIERNQTTKTATKMNKPEKCCFIDRKCNSAQKDEKKKKKPKQKQGNRISRRNNIVWTHNQRYIFFFLLLLA